MQVAKGLKEENVVIGNFFDKYNSKNPLIRLIMKAFNSRVHELIQKIDPKSIHEVGCGEGYWTIQWSRQNKTVRGTDFSSKVIELARANGIKYGVSPEIFQVMNIYSLEPDKHAAELIVCSEVLEHLDRPEEALAVLQKITESFLLLTVPHEPFWRIANFLSGRYMTSFGNTPGHIQHWTKGSLSRLVRPYFEIIEIKMPIPWIVILCKPHSVKTK